MLIFTLHNAIGGLVKFVGLTIKKITKGDFTMKQEFSTLWGCSKLGMSQPRWKMLY